MDSPGERDEQTYIPTDGMERLARHISRQDFLNEKRMRNTDVLPSIDESAFAGKTTIGPRQVSQLRDENRRLRREVEELQRRIIQHRHAEQRLEQDIDAVRYGHQLEIEQYQTNLREMMDELNQKQEALQEMEQRYQNLYHTFHESVESEAGKLVSEAAQTLILSPEHTPPILHDVMKTLEFQVKQTEDQHVAQLMALMRQAQRKTAQLELELENEREHIAEERQRLLVQQNSISEQAKLRQKYIESSLRARFTGIVTLIAGSVLVIFALLELAMVEYFKAPLYLALFSPIIFLVILAFVLARTSSNPGQPQKKPAAKPKPAEQTKPAT
jgi:septal ring factor EnvC (AmiA/AmiB activator)